MWTDDSLNKRLSNCVPVPPRVRKQLARGTTIPYLYIPAFPMENCYVLVAVHMTDIAVTELRACEPNEHRSVIARLHISDIPGLILIPKVLRVSSWFSSVIPDNFWDVGFEVLTAVVMKSTIFRDITPYSPSSVN
jgi:hypothetical protein